jgi:hypothetical protein
MNLLAALAASCVVGVACAQPVFVRESSQIRYPYNADDLYVDRKLMIEAVEQLHYPQGAGGLVTYKAAADSTITAKSFLSQPP